MSAVDPAMVLRRKGFLRPGWKEAISVITDVRSEVCRGRVAEPRSLAEPGLGAALGWLPGQC